MLNNLETKLNKLLVTDAPFQLPDGLKKWIGQYAWIFALVGAVLGILASLALLPLIGIGSFFAAASGSAALVLFIWLSLFVMIAYTALLCVATPRLKNMQKSGWNLIFYSNLFFIAYDILYWLGHITSVGAYFGLMWNLLWAAVGLYFVFQVRSQFLPKKAAKADKA
ncbi:MAG: hypothetical protein QG553_185 [Patescibacteria group bacterium]|nr:hypothetical protein [Patescibacteria group bacterium]